MTRGDVDAVEFDAVIVGGGPRGVATALRVAARVRATGDRPARLAMIDAIQVGAGATWWTEQPGAYLNNTLAGATTVHPDSSTPMTGPAAPGPDLLAWAADVVAAGGHPHADWVLDEARDLARDDFPTRRLQGVYFRDQLQAARDSGAVEVTEIVAHAVDVERDAQGRSVVILADGRRLAAPTVVLAQGMVQARPDDEVLRFSTAASRDARLRYVAPGMPAERDFTGLPARETVIVRGMGANFFDVVGQLAAEWGGTMTPVPGDPQGRVRYAPTGREARLVVGSRRGLPYRAKPDAGVPRAAVELRWATPEWFAGVLDRTGVDFLHDLWPTLARELAAAWLSAVERLDAAAVVRGWAQRLAHTDGVADIETVLAENILDPAWAWQIDHLRRPTGGAPVTPSQWKALLARHAAEELRSMSRPAEHPRAAVNATMGALRARVALLIRRGVFSGESLTRDVRGWFDADGLFLASGPPPARVRLLLALIDAGVVDLIGPMTTVGLDEETGMFVAQSAITGRVETARVLLETRMSKGKVPATDDPLLRALLDSGRARIHHVDGVPTASMEATAAPLEESTVQGHNLVAADGVVDPSLVVLGIPVDSTQPGSAIGATPGVPSPLLAGADIAAKQILARRCDRAGST